MSSEGIATPVARRQGRASLHLPTARGRVDKPRDRAAKMFPETGGSLIMIRRKNALLDTALACAERGIPVQAATVSGIPVGEWTIDLDAVRVVWDVDEPPNLAITSCPVVAVWRLPRIAGAYGKRLYEQQRPSVWPPTMQCQDGSWITCTLQPDGDLGSLATGVQYVAPGTPVVIPPSTTSDGRLHWDGAKFPLHPLPSADAVLSEVLRAEQEYVELNGQLG
jgi:hypothetical protein